MAVQFLIPRLEWNFITRSGSSTDGSADITGLSSTSDLSEGMYVSGSGIPADTTILSKTVNSVTLSNNATVTGSPSLTFFSRFDFRYPPMTDTDNELDPSEKVTTSLSGKRQVQVDFIEEKRAVSFGFLTSYEHLSLRNSFYVGWAVYGKEFRYYPDKADSSYEVYELSDYKFKPSRQVKKHPSFLYRLQLSFRRVLE